MKIIAAEATAIVAMAGFVVKLYADLKAAQKAHLESVQAHARVAEALVAEFREQKKGGQP